MFSFSHFLVEIQSYLAEKFLFVAHHYLSSGKQCRSNCYARNFMSSRLLIETYVSALNKSIVEPAGIN